MTEPAQLLPEPDFDGFVDWVEHSYTDDRWSDVYRRSRSVTVWSGKYPAFSRFQADLRPQLHKHGLVISDTRTNVPKTINGDQHSVHWVAAIPLVRAVAASHDMLCSRHACTKLLQAADAEYCGEVFERVCSSPEKGEG